MSPDRQGREPPIQKLADDVVAKDVAHQTTAGRPGKVDGVDSRSGFPAWVPIAGVATAIAVGIGLGVASGLNSGSSGQPQSTNAIGQPPPAIASLPPVNVTPQPPVTPAPAPVDWTLGSNGTWFHNGPGDSNLFDCMTTSPPQPGAAFTDMIVRPDASTTTMTGVLDAAGKASVSTPIHQYGTYTQTLSVTSGGITNSQAATTTVTPTQGQKCP